MVQQAGQPVLCKSNDKVVLTMHTRRRDRRAGSLLADGRIGGGSWVLDNATAVPTSWSEATLLTVVVAESCEL